MGRLLEDFRGHPTLKYGAAKRVRAEFARLANAKEIAHHARVDEVQRLPYVRFGNEARHSVVLPDCLGPVTLTTGQNRANSASCLLASR